MAQSSDSLEYAGFWPRFCAIWVDIFFMLPIIGFIYWGSRHYRLFDFYSFLPNQLFSLFYSVYLVRRYGGTPGKRVMKLSILKVDGNPIGYREAILRFLPDFILGFLASIALIIGYFQMTDTEFNTLSITDQYKRLAVLEPAWFHPVSVIQQVWMWSEFVVLLTNKKRRALHDFIAGTVVVISKKAI